MPPKNMGFNSQGVYTKSYWAPTHLLCFATNLVAITISCSIWNYQFNFFSSWNVSSLAGFREYNERCYPWTNHSISILITVMATPHFFKPFNLSSTVYGLIFCNTSKRIHRVICRPIKNHPRAPRPPCRQFPFPPPPPLLTPPSVSLNPFDLERENSNLDFTPRRPIKYRFFAEAFAGDRKHFGRLSQCCQRLRDDKYERWFFYPEG